VFETAEISSSCILPPYLLNSPIESNEHFDNCKETLPLVEFLFTCAEAVIVFLWNRAHICNKELDTSVPEWVYVNKRKGEHEITNFLLTKLEISFSDVHNVNPLRNACRREA